jgi:hypothetical protein
MRAIAGILVGLIAAFFAAVLVGIVAARLTFPVPAGIDAANPRQVLMAFVNIPPATQLALAAAWFAAGLAGAFVARRIGRSGLAAWLVAALVAAYFGLNANILAQPLWVQLLWTAAPLLGGLIGNSLLAARDPAAPATDIPSS